MTPKRLARIILGKIGIIGCTVGAYYAYQKPDSFGYYLMFVILAAISLLVVVNDVSKGDTDDVS